MIMLTVLLALVATLSTSCSLRTESAGDGHGGPPAYYGGGPPPSRERFHAEDRAAYEGRPYPVDPRMQQRVAGPPMGNGNRQPIPQPRGEGRLTVSGWEKMNGKLRPGGVIHWYNQAGQPVCASQVDEQGKRMLEADLRSRGYPGKITHYYFTGSGPSASVNPLVTPQTEQIPFDNLEQALPQGEPLPPLDPSGPAEQDAPDLPRWTGSSQMVRT